MTHPGLSSDPSPPLSTSAPSRLIYGDGEMADRVRAFDWASTPLGPIDTWPEILLSTVNTVLASRHPLFLWWGDDLIQFYNDAYRPSLGRNKHPAALGQRGQDCWAEVWDSIAPQIEATLRHGISTWNEDRLLPVSRNGKDLEDAYWTFSYSPVRDAAGVIHGVFVVVSETTARVLTERRLRSSEERLQLALEAAHLGTWFYDASTGLSIGDPAMQRIFGSPTSSGDFNYWIEFVHPEDREHVQREFTSAIAGNSPYESEYRILRPNGSSNSELRWIRSCGRVTLEPGLPLRMVVVVEDITESKLAQIELHTRARDLRESQRIGKMGSWHLDLATSHLTWSHEVYRLMERDPALPPTSPEENAAMFQDDSLDRLQHAVQNCIATRQPYELDACLRLPSGRLLWLATRGEPVLDDHGELIALRGTVRDITDRKLTEHALIRTEKLAAVGRLASSIAHEINNPLESVTNLLYLARSADDLAQNREYLALADSELRRASAITNQTLRFHRQATRPISVTCLDILSPVIGIHQSRLTNSAITLEKRKRAQRPISCLDGEIRQVIGNIIGNAIDAMQPTGGRLLVRSREGCDWRPAASGLPPRPGVILTVADTGSGIAPETLAKIFEPFFTTKGHAGTGLGLWISKEIIDRHNGTLSIRSSQHPAHHGTVFTVFLPFDPSPDGSSHRPLA